MNVEFHYYSTAFLAVKAGFSLADATTLAHAGQYVDHHHRGCRIHTGHGTLVSGPTQNFSFWDPATVTEVLAPFHFLPAGRDDRGDPFPSVRLDGATSVWDVRPNSPPAKTLLVAALRTKNLYRIGLALHTFSDTWAHQNFTAHNDPWNRLNPNNRLPSPGHAQAGFAPDLWLSVWDDPRLVGGRVVNRLRFAEAAQKVYRYLCTFRGKEFQDEEQVLAELDALVGAGVGRDSVEERALEFVLALNLEPYDKTRWWTQAVEPGVESTWPFLDKVKRAGSEILNKTGLTQPLDVKGRPGFADTSLAAWMRAAEEHRALAQDLVRRATE
jgi:hypothetical protein